jgi:hypothetical protein
MGDLDVEPRADRRKKWADLTSDEDNTSDEDFY